MFVCLLTSGSHFFDSLRDEQGYEATGDVQSFEAKSKGDPFELVPVEAGVQALKPQPSLEHTECIPLRLAP